MEFLHILITFLLVLLFMNMLLNLRMLDDQETVENKTDLPLISVLLPVRNEEKNIRTCILSLLEQNYPRLEIIVLDDDSTDNTFQIAKQLAQKSKKLKVVKGKDLPKDWNGKNWACHQLSQLARGEWFLFTDADTVHKESSISKAFAVAHKNNSGFITFLPGLTMKTWSEKLLLPIIHFAFTVLIPFNLINYSGYSRVPVGIGPFMFIKKKSFLTCGGYKAIKNEIVDDMALAKAVHKNNGKITVINGSPFMNVRFYTKLQEIWKGFSKNSYPAISSSPHFLLFVIIFCYFLFVYPYLSLWGAFESNEGLTHPLLQVCIISFMKIFLALKFETSLFYGLLHPFSVILWLLILLNSFRLSVFKRKFEWKERLYPIE